jgi:uncharacterized membrane protein SpoIIM required for sporulation
MSEKKVPIMLFLVVGLVVLLVSAFDSTIVHSSVPDDLASTYYKHCSTALSGLCKSKKIILLPQSNKNGGFAS